MYKNQLQELAQRSCFNLPSYSCLREGPDHAPRFKASVNFNGEIFESPGFCTTLRQAEHAAAEVALNALSTRGPSNSIAARILDETGVYKNLLQEIAQRVGAPLPSYTTVRTGLGHLPVFSGKVELAGVSFTGEPAKNKKQAEKNAAMAAWNCLKQLARQQQAGSPTADGESGEQQQQITTARALLSYRLRQKMAGEVQCLNFPVHPERRAPQQTPSTGSKILPLIRPTSAPRTRPPSPARGPVLPHDGTYAIRQLLQFSAAAAPPYVPLRHCATFRGGLAPPPPVTVRNSVPVFAAPPPGVPQRPPPVICPAERQVGGILPAFSATSRPLAAPRYDHPRSRPGGLVSESHRLNSGSTAARNVVPVDAADERRVLTQNLGEMKI